MNESRGGLHAELQHDPQGEQGESDDEIAHWHPWFDAVDPVAYNSSGPTMAGIYVSEPISLSMGPHSVSDATPHGVGGRCGEGAKFFLLGFRTPSPSSPGLFLRLGTGWGAAGKT